MQVAALLVSASYGAAFLLGSGEMAMHSRMAGSLYAVVTAFGMIALAMCARPLWNASEPIWGILGNAYGTPTRRAIAVLSLVWMVGVLAAQIHGGIAVLEIAGVPAKCAAAATMGAILATSLVDIGVLAVFFACCLLASNFILLRAIIESRGLYLYLHAWPAFLHDLHGLHGLQAPDVVTTIVAIGFLVVTGADYQQFVIAARRPADAWLGCILAGAFLLVTGFLPVVAVVVSLDSGKLAGVFNPAEAIPLLLLQTAGIAGKVCLGILGAAALGAGAAITRAMVYALVDTISLTARHAIVSRLLVIVTGGAIAIDGQTIVSTIVALNIVYVSAVGILFVLHQTGRRVTSRCAGWMLAAGTMSSLMVSAMSWSSIAQTPSWAALPAGLLASLVAGVGCNVVSTRHDAG